MRILTPNKQQLLFTILAICSINLYAQESNLTITQDPNFEQLLNEKRKINSSITVNDRYKIQVYSGDSENAKKSLSEFRKENKDFDATIVFNTPTYKVWVGNFKSRIEAERNLADFRKKFPNAFLIKPNK